MMWGGLLVGAVIGEMLWGWRGAVVLAFFGWLAVVVVQAQRRGNRTSPPRILAQPADRIAQLERTVATLEARLAAMEQATSSFPRSQPSNASVEGRESIDEGPPSGSTATFVATPDALELPEAGPVIADPVPEPLGAPIISVAFDVLLR